MEKISEKQKRHNALIDLLKQFSQYQDSNKKTVLKKRSKEIGSKDLVKLDCNEINNSVVVLTDFLNLSGGSIGDIDLYRLLQSYFLDLEKRKLFNEIVNS